jgi:hypothetical protein
MLTEDETLQLLLTILSAQRDQIETIITLAPPKLHAALAAFILTDVSEMHDRLRSGRSSRH